jgi:hypothetical protein
VLANIKEHPLLVAGFDDAEKYAWLCGSFGPLLILLLSTAVTLNGFVSHDKYVVVVVLLGVVPLLNLFFINRISRWSWLVRPGAAKALLVLNLSFVLAGTVWFGGPTFGLRLSRFNAGALSAEYLSALAVFLAFLYTCRKAILPSLGHRWLSVGTLVLVFVTPVLLTAAVVLSTNWFTIRPFNKWAALFGGAGALVTMVLWRVPLHTASANRWRKSLAWGTTILTFLAPFGMMDAQLSYDTLHYTAYLGPATAVASGRVPLIDVFSQYGQSYLIYSFALLFLPKTFHAAALVTTFCNATYILCGLIILRKLIRNHLVFLILGASLPFFFWLTYHYAATNTPSHGGLRYLPIFLTSTSLVLMSRQKVFTPFSVAAILLAWAWSFEATIYSSFVYATFLIARACSDSATLRGAIVLAVLYLGRLLALLALFVALVSSAYWVVTTRLPRYDLYLSLVLAYVGPDPFMDYTFYQSGFFGWVPVLVGYFVAVSMVVRKCLAENGGKPDWIAQLAVLVAMAVAIGVYCLISTQAFILKAVLLPFYLLLYWALEAAVSCRPKEAFVSVSEMWLAPVFIFLFAVLAGVSVSNFSGDPMYATPNTSALRHLVSYGWPLPQDFNQRLDSFCGPPSTIEPNSACSPGGHLPALHYDEFKSLLSRWQQDSSTLMTFHPLDTVMEVYYQKPHTLPLSFAYVDGFSPALFKYIVDRSRNIMAKELRAGQTVVMTKDLSLLNELQWALLTQLAVLWALERVDETEHLAVYRLVKDSTTAVGPLLTLPNRPVKTRNSL